nr:hypothetical protein [Promicromonospora panici]
MPVPVRASAALIPSNCACAIASNGKRAVALVERLACRRVAVDGVVVGLGQVDEGIRGDGVLDVDDSGECPAVGLLGHEHIAFVEDVVAEHGAEAVPDEAGLLGETGLHRCVQGGIAAERCVRRRPRGRP